MKLIQIHPRDNVAVALDTVAQGETISLAAGDLGKIEVTALEEIPKGHKIALTDIEEGGSVIKYGTVIAIASTAIKKGSWIHTHNAHTGLNGGTNFVYDHKVYDLPSYTDEEKAAKTFNGYRRPDGRAAVRNEIWIIPLVGCVNGIVKQLVNENQQLVGGLDRAKNPDGTNRYEEASKYASVDGLYCFNHPFGCSQLGDDLSRTGKLLAALVRHPNAGGVLCVGLGCENLTLDLFKKELGEYDPDRVKFLICQDTEDEIEEGSRLLKELADYAAGFHREPIPASELVVGLKCGGSDGLSGITANPTVGSFSDRLIALGGSTVLTEVPEMFGAENILFSRCLNKDVFDKAVGMVDKFKQYFISHNQPVYENPSPGNKKGGITTLEDKSCGCIQKGGSAQIVDVLDYAEPVTRKGLNLMTGPGNDLVSSTVLTAAGAHMILFTTGRGTPFGAPAPTAKIATNSALAARKSDWIDFNAGTVAEGRETPAQAGARLLDYVLRIASGEQTLAEKHGCRDISIFKDGVIL